MASRSIICRSRKLRQIIDLRNTDKSRYFAITVVVVVIVVVVVVEVSVHVRKCLVTFGNLRNLRKIVNKVITKFRCAYS